VGLYCSSFRALTHRLHPVSGAGVLPGRSMRCITMMRPDLERPNASGQAMHMERRILGVEQVGARKVCFKLSFAQKAREPVAIGRAC